MLMDNCYGIKASDLIKELKIYMNKFGDLYVCKNINDTSRPIYCISHYPNTDYFELT